jgi:hypothetical protein
VSPSKIQRLAAIGLVGDFFLANLAVVAAASFLPSGVFAGRVETALLDMLHVCEIPNTILDELVGIAALAISVIINMVAN